MKLDYKYIHEIIKINNVDEIEKEINANKNMNKYCEILHKNLIIKEVEINTNKMLEFDKENKIGSSIIKFVSGNCWFNTKLSHGHKIEEHEEKIINGINEGVKLVKQLTQPVSLFHGFEKYVNYKKINDTISVPGIVAKTLSINVAKRFAYSTNSLRPEFLVVHYDIGSSHLKQSIRPFDEEFEFITKSNESYKIIRVCKYFDGIRLLTFYVCKPN